MEPVCNCIHNTAVLYMDSEPISYMDMRYAYCISILYGINYMYRTALSRCDLVT